MEHTKHVWRAALILVFLFVVMIVGRHFLIPESFGKTGFYRYDSVGEFMARPVMHGGGKSCKKCHEDQYDAVQKGKHAPVSCEVCHAPLAGHVVDGDKSADMPMNPSHELCGRCHQKLEARPAAFPQVDLGAHLEEQGLPSGGKIPQKVCLKCHEVHSPSADE